MPHSSRDTAHLLQRHHTTAGGGVTAAAFSRAVLARDADENLGTVLEYSHARLAMRARRLSSSSTLLPVETRAPLPLQFGERLPATRQYYGSGCRLPAHCATRASIF